MSVPSIVKRVTLQVLRAANVLSRLGFEDGFTVYDIRTQIRYQMRNQDAVPNLMREICKATKSLILIGLMALQGNGRMILVNYKKRGTNGRSDDPADDDTSESSEDDEKSEISEEDNKPESNKRKFDLSQSQTGMDPENPRTSFSEDSMSGDELEKSVKRLRPQRKIKFKGKDVLLPKVRQSKPDLDDDSVYFL